MVTNPSCPQEPDAASPLHDALSSHGLVLAGGAPSSPPLRQLSPFPSTQLQFIGLLCPRGIAATANEVIPDQAPTGRESRVNPCATDTSHSTEEQLCLEKSS